MRPTYPYKKQIKIDYKVQFPSDLMLIDEIKKNQLKNIQKTTRVILG
jgi:hypothetical protein